MPYRISVNLIFVSLKIFHIIHKSGVFISIHNKNV